MLIAVVSGFLGVPLWLIVGVLVFTFWTRRKFKKMEGVFPFKGRRESGLVPEFGNKYSWRSGYGRWVHDVLLVHKGLALVHTVPLGVNEMIGDPAPAGDEQVKRMGKEPMLLRLRLDNEAVLRLVVKKEDLNDAIGSRDWFHKD